MNYTMNKPILLESDWNYCYHIYTIESKTSTTQYRVVHDIKSDSLACDCKGYRYGGKCYHIAEVKSYISLHRNTNMEKNENKKFLDKGAGEYIDDKLMPVLVEADKYTGKLKVFTMSINLESRTDGLWIPRIILSEQERDKMVSNIIKVEKSTFVTPMTKKDLEYLPDSDIYRLNSQLRESNLEVSAL